MVEYLNAVDREGKLVTSGPRERILGDAQEAYRKTGEVIYAVPVVMVIPKNSEGLWHLQWRAPSKPEDPEKLSVTEGHQKTGQSADEAAVAETYEELGARVRIVDSIDYLAEVRKGQLFTPQGFATQIDFDPWNITVRLDRDSGDYWLKAHRLRSE